MEETRQRDKDPARYMIWVVYMCIPTGSYYGDYKQVRFAIIMTPVSRTQGLVSDTILI